MIACVKFFASIFAFVVFALGVITAGAGIYLQSNKPQFWTLIDLSSYDDYYKFGCIGLIVLGGFVIICAIFGIYGSCKKSKCSISIYQIAVLILFLLFVAVGVAIIFLFQPFYNEMKKDVNCNSDNKDLAFLADVNDLYNKAYDSFYCKQYEIEVDGQIFTQDGEECTCFIQGDLQGEWTTKFGADFYNGKLITENGEEGVTQLIQCPYLMKYQDSDDFGELYEQWSPLAEYIEENFSCAGVCDPQPFYMFSDINNGIPQNNEFTDNNPRVGTGCLDEITRFVGYFKDLVLIFSFGAAGFMLLNIVLGCCLCCYSSKNKEMGSYVQMGNYYD